MERYRIENFHELHVLLDIYRKSTLWLFRGQSNPEWKLIAKAGRPPYKGISDENMFKAWKRRAVEFIGYTPRNDWDWLAIAQHHGLATRLLDWSINPLVATFFAVEGLANSDAVIFAYYNKQREIDTDKKTNPFEHNGIGKFKPYGIAQRIVRQGGIFTIHNPSDLALEDNLSEGDQLDKIIIDSTYVKELQFELSHYGIDRLNLFSDLDGLSAHINWFMENIGYWKPN